MTAQLWDNVALACALAALLLRMMDRPRASAILSSICLAATTLGRWLAYRDQYRRDVAAARRGR